MSEIDTPALIIDLQKVRINLERAQKYANEHGLELRPHIKTHKLPFIAKMQLEAGAVGINCQKVSEAEAMVEGLGPDVDSDVLITYNIIGQPKLERLMRLLGKCDKLCVIVDSEYSLGQLANALKHADSVDTQGKRLFVKIECDTGGLRAGVVEPAKALSLAQKIISHSSDGLVFDGLMTYPAHHAEEQVGEWLAQASKLFTAASVPIPAVTVGGTPDMWTVHKIKGVTEMRPGTYVYNDRAIINSHAAELEWCAQTVLSTVSSKPTPLRAVCDAGSKALSSDLLGLSDFGYILEHPRAKLTRLSEEHGVIEAENPADMPDIGEQIHIIPNHSCVVTNLFDDAYLVDVTEVTKVPIPARGKSQ